MYFQPYSRLFSFLKRNLIKRNSQLVNSVYTVPSGIKPTSSWIKSDHFYLPKMKVAMENNTCLLTSITFSGSPCPLPFCGGLCPTIRTNSREIVQFG